MRIYVLRGSIVIIRVSCSSLFYFISFIVDNKNIYVYYPYVYRNYIGGI